MGNFSVHDTCADLTLQLLGHRKRAANPVGTRAEATGFGRQQHLQGEERGFGRAGPVVVQYEVGSTIRRPGLRQS